MGPFLDKALEFASRVQNPYALAAFSMVLICALIFFRKRLKPWIFILLSAVFLIPASIPLVSNAILASKGIYHIRVIVVEPDGQPASQATIICSVGGELKQGNGNWEFDLPPQIKPSSGRVAFYASVKDSYLAGESALTLKGDYFPEVIIHLSSLPDVSIRGVVIDESGRSVVGAFISVVGYPQIATSNSMGNFSIDSHHAAGQLTEVRAEKGNLRADVSAIAGQDVELVLRRQ